MSAYERLGEVAARYLKPERGCGGCVVTLTTEEHLRDRCAPCLTADLLVRGAMLDAEDEGKAEREAMFAGTIGQQAN